MLEQERLQPAHPGEVLAGEFLAPKGRIAGDTALRLAVAFGITAEFWMGCRCGGRWRWRRGFRSLRLCLQSLWCGFRQRRHSIVNIVIYR